MYFDSGVSALQLAHAMVCRYGALAYYYPSVGQAQKLDIYRSCIQSSNAVGDHPPDSTKPWQVHIFQQYTFVTRNRLLESSADDLEKDAIATFFIEAANDESRLSALPANLRGEAVRVCTLQMVPFNHSLESHI